MWRGGEVTLTSITQVSDLHPQSPRLVHYINFCFSHVIENMTCDKVSFKLRIFLGGCLIHGVFHED